MPWLLLIPLCTSQGRLQVDVGPWTSELLWASTFVSSSGQSPQAQSSWHLPRFSVLKTSALVLVCTLLQSVVINMRHKNLMFPLSPSLMAITSRKPLTITYCMKGANGRYETLGRNMCAPQRQPRERHHRHQTHPLVQGIIASVNLLSSPLTTVFNAMYMPTWC